MENVLDLKERVHDSKSPEIHFLFPSALNANASATPDNSSVQLLELVVSIQRSIQEVQRSHVEHQQSIRTFIQQELQLLNKSVALEVQGSKDECLRSIELAQRAFQSQQDKGECLGDNENIQKFLEKHDSRLEAILAHMEGKAKRSSTVTPDAWKSFHETVEDVDPTCMYKAEMERKLTKRSLWHEMFLHLNCLHMLSDKMPSTCLARATEHPVFIACQMLLIFANTCLMGYETDVSIKAALQEPEGEVPKWIGLSNLIFNVIFALELLFRMFALGIWFWVAPSDWQWNVFDICLVISSLVSDAFSGINLSFIRMFRFLRVVRVARIIRVLRFFRHLRRMLFAILACLGSLAWAFVFLGMVMFMFSILFVQGAVFSLNDLRKTSEEYIQVRNETKRWFGSLTDAMMSLLAAVTGGADWLTIRGPLEHTGALYSLAFVAYMLFVTVGVMNVLTGVFLNSAEDFVDMSMIVQNEEVRVERFVEQMLELFNSLDVCHTGQVDWPTFNQVLRDARLRAYFSSLQLEPTHIRLMFDLLDERGEGKINLNDFLIGMVRLKGEAKAIDARIIQRELSMLPMFFRNLTVKDSALETDV
mmetsp:Transcript_101993/g.186938  ORF Transcript_101993/g.186938 Transcript_101993/m.186938 type:complete len:590 (+) Transcript_101993:74-1843(+)